MQKIVADRLDIDFDGNFLGQELADELLEWVGIQTWKRFNRREKLIWGIAGTEYKVNFKGKEVSYPVKDWKGQKPLLAVKSKLQELGFESKVCVIQRYKNGSIGMAKHKDREMAGQPIYGVSIGATRTLTMHPPGWRKDPNIDIQLQHGSLYILNPPTNQYWMHSIEPEASVQGVRYSFTFR